MEIIAKFCDCNIDDNFNYIEVCFNCKRSIHIKILQQYHDEIKLESTVDDRIIIFKKIFEYLLTCIDFLLSEKSNKCKNNIIILEEIFNETINNNYDYKETMKDFFIKNNISFKLFLSEVKYDCTIKNNQIHINEIPLNLNLH